MVAQAADDASELELRRILDRAQQFAEGPKALGDAIIAAFFSSTKPKERAAALVELEHLVAHTGSGWQERITAFAEGLSVRPFHWQLEFPEVFDRTNGGFDAIVGNPPFAGKNTIASGGPEGILDWLKTLHEGAHGNADLVAHFFRRAFHLLRRGGALGLVATNTIRQGDTRATGLRPIREAGGTIYDAVRRMKWPGEAAVVIATIHIAKAPEPMAGSQTLRSRMASGVASAPSRSRVGSSAFPTMGSVRLLGV